MIKKMLTYGCAATLISMTLGGCASMENQDAMDTERRLSAAGFQMKLADTPEKLTHLTSLPQRKVFATKKDGNLVYIYADATSCKCFYAGSEPDYQEYQRISLQQRAVNEQRDAAADIEMAQMNAQMNWGLWGGYRRPLFY